LQSWIDQLRWQRLAPVFLQHTTFHSRAVML